MICSLSGTVPERAVVSKYGHIYEKHLILKYLSSHDGKCPHTQQDLSEDDFIEIKQGGGTVVKPRNIVGTSIPSMIQAFQSEWDSIILESFQLKQQLDATRQELAQALYQHDAACRVIARLVKERDEARKVLQEVQVSGLSSVAVQNSDSMEVDNSANTNNANNNSSNSTSSLEEIIEKMVDVSKSLSSQRKKRSISSDLATTENLQAYTVLSSHPLHKTTTPGVLCLDIHPKHQNKIITGGADKSINIFDRTTGKVTHTLTGHTKKLTDVVFHPNEDIFLSASSDKTARVWLAEGNSYTTSQIVKTHTSEVSELDLHPVGDYFVSGSLDGAIGLHDLHTGTTYLKLQEKENAVGVTATRFHPDGLILGAGMTDSNVRIWDVKSQQNVATFVGHKGKIASIAFSENGFYMATAAEDATIKLWDLRKLKNFNSITLEDRQYAISAIHFDYSGTYLAVAGTDTRVFVTKSLSPVATYTGHSALVTDVQFGRDAKFLATTSMDRYLKFYGQQ